MIKNITYKSNNNIVFSCKYHIVWCPKYRRKVLTDEVETRLKEIIYEIAKELRVEIIEIEINKNYIHILIDIDPQFGVMNFVKKAKSRSSKLLRNEFHFLKTKLPTLWTNSSFISTIGGTSLEAIKQYIENQQRSERPKEKNKWKDYLKSCEMKND